MTDLTPSPTAASNEPKQPVPPPVANKPENKPAPVPPPPAAKPAPAPAAAKPVPTPAPSPAAPPKPAAAAPASEPRRAPEPPPPARGGGGVVGGLALLGVLAVGGGLYYVWDQQQQLLAGGGDRTAIAALQSQVQTLQQHLAAVEQRPAPSPAPTVDLRPLEQRLAALDQRTAELAQRPVAQAPDLGPLQARIDSLTQEAQAAREQAQAAQSDQSTLGNQLKTVEQQLAQAKADASQSAARAARVARVQAASAALDAGQPLGDIPGAPPALTRFALAKPPTEAALRLSFPAAAAAAMQASEPSTAGENVAERMWQRAQALVTVKEGEKVIVGAPAATIIAAAREKLEAGDLAGTLASLKQLDGPAAAAMADWRNQAQALLDARAALTDMAKS